MLRQLLPIVIFILRWIDAAPGIFAVSSRELRYRQPYIMTETGKSLRHFHGLDRICTPGWYVRGRSNGDVHVLALLSSSIERIFRVIMVELEM